MGCKKRPKWTTIVRSSGLRVAPYTGDWFSAGGKVGRARGTAEDFLQEFARRFARVWRSIPLADRRTLRHHWRIGPGRTHAAFLVNEISQQVGLEPSVGAATSPFIAVEDMLQAGTAAGQCSCNGHVLQFVIPYMFPVSKPYVGFVIAHELGHALRCATGASLELAHRWGYPSEAYEQEEELEADMLAARWGFPRCPLVSKV